MTCNIGKTDRMIRLLLAVFIAGVGLYFQSWWGLLALAPLLTGASLFCPVYKIFGLSTCTSNKRVQ